MTPIQVVFKDKNITYDDFMNDLAARIVSLISQNKEKDLPTYMSQRQAYAEFGERNVKRWKKNNQIIPHVRPGKVEYETAVLLKLRSQIQDYFNS